MNEYIRLTAYVKKNKFKFDNKAAPNLSIKYRNIFGKSGETWQGKNIVASQHVITTEAVQVPKFAFSSMISLILFLVAETK